MNDNTVKKKILYTADEFFKMTDLPEMCELINGEIYDMSPSPGYVHQCLVTDLSRKIGNYIEDNQGSCRVLVAPSDVMLNDDNVIQPDVFVVCDKSKFNEHGCVGAPDWVIEIVSPSSIERDHVDKLLLYSESGVKEYWIIDPIKERVFVFLFVKPNITGIYTFEDSIRVNLYKDNTPPLDICIAELLKLLQ